MRTPRRVPGSALCLFAACTLLTAPALPVAAQPVLGAAFRLEALPALARPEGVSQLTLAAGSITGFGDSSPKKERARKGKEKAGEREKPPKPPRAPSEGLPLGAERARILLQSLTVPGWGQATLGHRRSGSVFLVAEAGIWGAFAAFRVQEHLRTDTYERTARLFAGIDLEGRDDEFRRIVGSFASSEEYNQLVVTRIAANQYLFDPANPDMAGYLAYIEQHSLRGADAWDWTDFESFRRFGSQRKDAQRAALRSNTALGLAIANRLLSALHAARLAGTTRPPEPRSWRFEVTPGPGDDPTALRAGLRATF